MRYYLNPNNSNFENLIKNGAYMDKSLLIKHVSSLIDTKKNIICSS